MTVMPDILRGDRRVEIGPVPGRCERVADGLAKQGSELRGRLRGHSVGDLPLAADIGKTCVADVVVDHQ